MSSSVAWMTFFWKKIVAYTHTRSHVHTCRLCMLLCLTWFSRPVISAHGASWKWQTTQGKDMRQHCTVFLCICVCLCIFVRLHPAFFWLMECEGIMLIQFITGARWHSHYTGECVFVGICPCMAVFHTPRQVNGDSRSIENVPVLLSSVQKANIAESVH